MRAILALALLLTCAAPAAAHPHILVDARLQLILDAEGRLTAVRHSWTLDEGFSAFAIQGLDANRDGRYDRAELQELAQVNVTSLAEYRWYTFGSQDARRLTFGPASDHHLDHDARTGKLTLHFTLPVRTPVGGGGREVLVRVFDPEYFVAIDFVETDPVTLSGGPAGCTVRFTRPRPLDAGTAMELARIPADVRNLPPTLLAVTQGLSNDATVVCP